MKIKIIGMWGVDCMEGYFRKSGDGCFDFTWHEDWASEFTKEETDKILANKNWYHNMYGGELIVV